MVLSSSSIWNVNNSLFFVVFVFFSFFFCIGDSEWMIKGVILNIVYAVTQWYTFETIEKKHNISSTVGTRENFNIA